MIKTKHDGFRGGYRVLPKDGGSSPPPPPDYKAISDAQTKSNIDTANYNAALNRVNQFTPYGSLTYTQTPGQSTFDQAGYDAAMAKYQASLASPRTTTIGSGDQAETVTTPGSSLTAPNKADFTTTGPAQWNSTITLSPQQQALLDQQNAIQQGLGKTAQTALGNVQTTMGKPFSPNLGAYGQIPHAGGNSAQQVSAQQQNTTGAGAYDGSNIGPYTQSVQGGGIQTSLPNSDYANARTRVEDAIYSRVNPQLQRDRQALDAKLANQGIMPGSEAYNRAIDESNRQANDARMQAVLAGGQEQSRLAGLDLQAGQFANNAQNQGFTQGLANANLNNSVNDTQFNQGLSLQQQINQALAQNNAAIGANNSANFAAAGQNNAANLAANSQNYNQGLASANLADQQRQQQLQEQSYLYNMPLNTLTALMSGNQVTNPNFTAVPGANVANTNIAGNAYQSYQNALQNQSLQNAQSNSMTNGLFNLGAAALTKFSDRRLKRNIQQIGTYRGIGVYKYDYVWGEHAIGLMADEVAKIAPEAIGDHNGFMTVDYSKV